MKPVLLITSSEVAYLKKQAKRLQRKSGLPHHQILEALARDTGFANWHQLTLAAPKTRTLE